MSIRFARAQSLRLVGLLAAVVILGSCTVSWSALGFGPDRAGNNTAETTLTTANVAGLTEAWTAAVPGAPNGSPPIVANGSVFIAAGSLLAFSADGSTGCAGTPKVCQPLWTAANGGTASPTAAGNIVYTVSAGLLTAYDARGTTNCSGTPKTCTPLWTAAVGSAASSPAVANGKVYVRSDKLYAFDAAGTTGCSGTPKTCAPLWTASGSMSGEPAVSGGVVYANSAGSILAFDGAGVQGCSGTPTTCAPIRTYQTSAEPECALHGCNMAGAPSVAGGRVFSLGVDCCSMATGQVFVFSFDATGASGCSGTPVVCVPLNHAAIGSSSVPIAKAPVAIANGTVYAATLGTMDALDATTLAKKWSTTVGSLSSASIAGGVLYTLDFDQPNSRLVPRAFDAAGVTGCSGTPLKCAPLFTSASGPTVSLGDLISTALIGPTVVNGTMYVRTDKLRVSTLP